MFLLTNLFEDINQPIELINNCYFRNPISDEEIKTVSSFIDYLTTSWDTYYDEENHLSGSHVIQSFLDIPKKEKPNFSRMEMITLIAKKWVIFEYNQQIVDLLCFNIKTVEMIFDHEYSEVTEDIIDFAIEQEFCRKMNSIFALIGNINRYFSYDTKTYNFFHQPKYFTTSMSADTASFLMSTHYYGNSDAILTDVLLSRVSEIVKNFSSPINKFLYSGMNIQEVLFKSELIYNYYTSDNFSMKFVNLLLLIEGIVTSNPDESKYHIENSITKQFSTKIALLSELYPEIKRNSFTYKLNNNLVIDFDIFLKIPVMQVRIADELRKLYELRSAIIHSKHNQFLNMLKKLDEFYKETSEEYKNLNIIHPNEIPTYTYTSSTKSMLVQNDGFIKNPDVRIERLKQFVLKKLFAYASIVNWFDNNRPRLIEILSEKRA